MTKQRPDQNEHQWEGFKEVDRAITENRLTSYSWKKAWADRWARAVILAAAFILIGFVVFVIVQDVIL
ncbi:hypothetical protein H0274_00485 [Altererythrobacter sp. CC-YST694]|uniref:hypothetical protein n=1 Tax=Altererythrobacter sp. CC-YST694 TaxID=2755038 RepID=UPI001D0058BF|nr:hypothetical protein [Altererythrobacter sp. CC-YST694]MCB5423718.1 hypothetical protein [Altererythrobacter sp. CC-YST694]